MGGGGGGGGIGMGGVDVVAGDSSGGKGKGLGESTSFLAKLLSSYSNFLVKYPYQTKILSSAIIGGLGDVLTFDDSLFFHVSLAFTLRLLFIYGLDG